MTTTSFTLVVLALTWATAVIYSVIWRLYFSPLAKFPGPKLAAATLLYEMYYDIVAGGQYTFKIRDMHEKYGPIVRINPWELHISDPEFYDEVYAGGSKKRDKWPYLCGQFGTPDAALSTVSHSHHRLRRLPMNKMFSKGSIAKLEPLIHSCSDTTKEIQAKCQTAIEETSKGANIKSRRTIFHEILASDLSPEEKRADRLMQEGVVLIGAGTETTAWALSVITYYVLANPVINSKLKAELNKLSEESGGSPSLVQLEKLPYLSGVISEGLRLSFGVTAHLQRVSPDQELIYGDWVIPAGTPVSMTSLLLHLNPKTFPDPNSFNPERWIENPRLSKYLISFSKGSRQCLGINLAYAELYLCIYKVWMAFPDMRLVDTTKKDVEIIADYFVPVASGRGVKVVMG
ncbi:cytochrome P450 [Leptodontidium sp. MPI-SDFR-AT-0119]|nr:cytochrome P450 [Leptodontidium sp. MPI-SDFR-AT-0119]